LFLDDANKKKDGEKLSGIQKYGRKIRERDRDMIYSRSVSRETAETFEETKPREYKKNARRGDMRLQNMKSSASIRLKPPKTDPMKMPLKS